MPLRYVPIEEPRLFTVGRIAERYGVPVHRVQYVVKSRQIRPAARAGRVRLFDHQALGQIKLALEATAGEGGGL